MNPDDVVILPRPPRPARDRGAPLLPPEAPKPAPNLPVIALGLAVALAAGYGLAHIFHTRVPWGRMPRLTVVVTTAVPDYVPAEIE